MTIQYVKGDATDPIGSGNKIIVHCCNDIGAWGRGFVCAISKRWPEPEQEYRRWFNEKTPTFALGEVQFVAVSSSITICNLIGQRDIRRRGLPLEPPVRYEAIKAGFKKLFIEAKRTGASIHMPRLGCGLAGGSWGVIESIIRRELPDINVTVYDL